MAWRASGGAPSARAARLHVLRGAITAAMALLFFWGLAHVPMAQAISLTYVAPLLALLLGAWWLGERVGSRIVGASLAALCGVAIILAGHRHAAMDRRRPRAWRRSWSLRCCTRSTWSSRGCRARLRGRGRSRSSSPPS
ncbi:EamA family transporter [Sphingomonas sp. MMS24-JH45]